MAVVVRDVLYSLRGLALLLWGASFANLFIPTSECSSLLSSLSSLSFLLSLSLPVAIVKLLSSR